MRESLVLALLAGCASQGLTSPDDGGADMPVSGDMSTSRVDLAGATCSDIASAEQAYIDAHKSCVRDSDCAQTTTPCGLPGTCGTWLAVSAVAGLATFDNAWTAMGCMGPCPPCAFPPPAYCASGTCAPLPFSNRPIGSPCGSDSECISNGSLPGVCLQDPTFPNGDCVVDCGTNNACPSGTLCRPNMAFPAHTLECFPACGGDPDCRTGYKCCPSWVPTSPGMVCYPGPCP
jgi:hypothetical protein